MTPHTPAHEPDQDICLCLHLAKHAVEAGQQLAAVAGVVLAVNELLIIAVRRLDELWKQCTATRFFFF